VPDDNESSTVDFAFEDSALPDDAPRAQLRIAESFVEDVARIYSPRIDQRIKNALLMLEHNPDIGSPLVRKSLVAIYGPKIRTFAISSFILVYRHEGDYVDVLALVYGPTIR
jgi:hypothetical protein